MVRVLAPVGALLLSTAFVLLGNGLQGMLVPVRAQIEAFSTIEIGVMGSVYFVGFAAGCLYGPWIVRRAGHIRAFSALASAVSATALLHSMVVDPIVWWVLRGLTGLCFAAIYVVIESWLNERATNETRGLVYGVYTAIYLSVFVAGQLLITVADPRAFVLFGVASILVSIAVLPVAMTASPQPLPIHEVKVRPARLFAASPVGVVGCFAVGATNGAFWALGPLYASGVGFDIDGMAYMLAGSMLAGSLTQLPLGRASDRVDRRRVIFVVSAVCAGAGAILAFAPSLTATTTMMLVFLFGAGAFPLYALCMAHANDHTESGDFVEVASGLLLTYGLGSIVGPLVASAMMNAAGAPMMFLFTAAVHLAFAAFALYRMTRRARAPEETREEFVIIPRTAPTAFDLSPQGEDEAEPGHEEKVG